MEFLIFHLKSHISFSTKQMSHVPKKWQVWHLFTVSKLNYGFKCSNGATLFWLQLNLQLAPAFLPSLPYGELQNKVLHMFLLNYTESYWGQIKIVPKEGRQNKKLEVGTNPVFSRVPISLAKLFEIQLDASSNKIATLIRSTPSLSEITLCSGQTIGRGRRTGIVWRKDRTEIGTNKGKEPFKYTTNTGEVFSFSSPFLRQWDFRRFGTEWEKIPSVNSQCKCATTHPLNSNNNNAYLVVWIHKIATLGRSGSFHYKAICCCY